jgi:DNA-binding transcriptional ArsR family regulator
MGEFEEETYSTVFTALKHPVRRRILRTLSKDSQTFTDLQSAFKVNGAVLTYHLDAMKDLICKTEDGKYGLSTMGEGAMALMERVEDPPKVTPTKPSHKNSRRLSILQSVTICIAVVLLVSGTYLTSIPAVQTFYDVPTGWSAARYFGTEFYRIDDNSYDVRYSLFVDPPNQLLNQLTEEHEADIYVNLKTNGTVETWFHHYTNEASNQTTVTAPSALYFVTLTHSEYSSVDDM